MALEITNNNFKTEIKDSKKPTILKVYADWCGPCKQLEPIFEEISNEQGDKYTFAKLNVDNAREASIDLGVSSIPTMIFIKDGDVVGRETGYMPKEDLVAKITEYLG